MPGPPRTPPETLRKRGSRLAPERERDQVHGVHGIPEPPDWLMEAARSVWDKVVSVLEPMGVLCLSDGLVLARYCTLWVQWQQCQEDIEAHGFTYDLLDKSGSVRCIYKRPQVALVIQLGDQLLKLEQEFGLTPSARSRVRAVKPQSPPDGKRFPFRIA